MGSQDTGAGSESLSQFVFDAGIVRFPERPYTKGDAIVT
jgi:hypothetical protein